MFVLVVHDETLSQKMRYGFQCADQQQKKKLHKQQSHTHKKKSFFRLCFLLHFFFLFLFLIFGAAHTTFSWLHLAASKNDTLGKKKKLQRLEHTITHACTQASLETGSRYSIPASGETFCFAFFFSSSKCDIGVTPGALLRATSVQACV